MKDNHWIKINACKNTTYKNAACKNAEPASNQVADQCGLLQSFSLKTVIFILSVVWTLSVQAVNINFGPNGCTLQDAIRSANTDSAVGNCSSGSGHDFLIAPDVWPITLNARLPTITSDMTITTATPSGLLKISGDNNHAVMKVTGQATALTLRRVFITEADASLIRGPALHIEDAEVNLEGTIFSFNRTTAKLGGAIYIEDGTLNIENSYLEYNTALNNGNPLAKGGAIYAVDSMVDIYQSRFVFNEARSRLANIQGEVRYFDEGHGASVFMQGGELTVTDSLFDEPDSAIHGEQNMASISNSTINRSQTLNWEDQRGHVYFSDFSSLSLNHVTIKAAMRLEHSIFNMTNSILQGECNIAGTTTWIIDAGNIYNTPNHSCPDTGNLFYYPKLLSLSNNGGLTETFKLLYSSDAINAGDSNYCLPTDQRGVSRDTRCDIGAYEEVGFADIEVAGEMEQSAPYVHGQTVVYEATIRNNSATLVNEIRLDVDTDHATIIDIDYAACPSFPCTLTAIQGFQEITIPVTLNLASFDDDFTVEISAEQTSNAIFTDTDLNNNQAILNESIVDGADLALNMQLLNPGNHFIGQEIKYQATIENLGFDASTMTEFEFLPTGLNLISMTGCDSVTGQVCQLGSLNHGSSQTVDVLAVMNQSEFDAIGQVSSAVHDINSSNNIDLLGNNGALGETDVSIAVTPLIAAPYYSYGYIEFNVAISTGNQSASNLRLVADFPGSEFINCNVSINLDGYCEIPFIAANSVFNVTLQYFNPITTGSAQQQFPLSVFVTTGEIDLNLSDNQQTIQIPIDATSDMAAQLSFTATPPYYSGQELEFKLRIVNGGVNHASAVDITMIPDNLSLVWESGNLCPSTPCNLSQLERFNEENMTMVYRIIDAGEFSLTASVQASQIDANPNNNIDVEMGEAVLALDDLIFADSFEP